MTFLETLRKQEREKNAKQHIAMLQREYPTEPLDDDDEYTPDEPLGKLADKAGETSHQLQKMVRAMRSAEVIRAIKTKQRQDWQENLNELIKKAGRGKKKHVTPPTSNKKTTPQPAHPHGVKK